MLIIYEIILFWFVENLLNYKLWVLYINYLFILIVLLFLFFFVYLVICFRNVKVFLEVKDVFFKVVDVYK